MKRSNLLSLIGVDYTFRL